MKRFFGLTIVALGLGLAGGWVLHESDEKDEQAAAGWNTCVNPVAGFSIEYPYAWYTDHPRGGPACRFFDPRRFEVPEDGDYGGTALEVLAVGRFEDAVDSWTNPRFVKVLDREELQVAGRRAVLLHTETTHGAEFEQGTRNYLYIIERDPETLVVRTTSQPGIDYTAWRRIVDRAARSLRFTAQQDRSVEGAEVVSPQAGLPELVSRKRALIWAAAREKDFEALGRLVDPKGFEYTFGGPVAGGPAAYWRRLEQTTTEQPLKTLAAILELSFVFDQQSKLYVWPHVFSRKASSLGIHEKGELADAIGEDALRFYEQSDNYLGYRAGIDARGNWVFYVAGD